MCGDIHKDFISLLIEAFFTAVTKAFDSIKDNVSITTFHRHIRGVSYNRRRVIHYINSILTTTQILDDGTVFKGTTLPDGAKVLKENKLDDKMTFICFTAPSSTNTNQLICTLIHFRQQINFFYVMFI